MRKVGREKWGKKSWVTKVGLEKWGQKSGAQSGREKLRKERKGARKVG